MNNKNKIEKILREPSYWIESVNSMLYDAIINYMESKNLNRTQLANELQVSKGRISQILNDGEINFSIHKIVEIALKIGVFPHFELIDQQKYLSKYTGYKNSMVLLDDYSAIMSNEPDLKGKVIKLHPINNYTSELVI